MLQYLVIVGAGFSLVGIVSYLKDTLSGRAKPNKVSWLMWAIAPAIAIAAAISKGVTWAVLPVFMAGFGPLCILVASFFSKKAYWKLTVFDYLCGVFSVLALILWVVTKDANTAIIFAILADGSAALPTLKKAWTHPETESAMIFITGTMGDLTAFAAIKYWIFSSYAFVTYLILINLCILFSIVRKRIFCL